MKKSTMFKSQELDLIVRIMKGITTLTIIVFILSLSSCDLLPAKEKKKLNTGTDWYITKNGDSVLRRFRKDGTVESYSTMVNDVKQGKAKRFHENGNPEFEINYKNGKKHGIVKWFYESGQLYRESIYVNGQINGIQKKYYKNGALMAEIPYDMGTVQPGLKEYLKRGKLKENTPKLYIKAIDRVALESKYVLQLSLSNKAKKAKYFQEVSFDNSDRTALKELDSENGIGQLIYYVAPGGFIMEKVKLRAEFKTSLGNKCVVERMYNVSVDN